MRTPIASEAEGGAIHPDDAKAGGHNLKLGWELLALGGHIEPKRAVFDTPDTMPEAPNTGSNRKSQVAGLGNQVKSLLPTTRAQNGEDRNQRIYARADGKPQNLENALATLPTPTVVDLGNNKTIEQWEKWTDEQREKHGNGNGHGASLSIEALKLLPTTMASMKGASSNEIENGNPRSRLEVEVFLPERWGKFRPAIELWERITGHKVPEPTIPDGKNGQHRLNPEFTEWMMGVNPGHITGVDITRNEQLKACGNGVVPQQAALALRILGAKKYVIQDN